MRQICNANTPQKDQILPRLTSPLETLKSPHLASLALPFIRYTTAWLPVVARLAPPCPTHPLAHHVGLLGDCSLRNRLPPPRHLCFPIHFPPGLLGPLAKPNHCPGLVGCIARLPCCPTLAWSLPHQAGSFPRVLPAQQLRCWGRFEPFCFTHTLAPCHNSSRRFPRDIQSLGASRQAIVQAAELPLPFPPHPAFLPHSLALICP